MIRLSWSDGYEAVRAALQVIRSFVSHKRGKKVAAVYVTNEPQTTQRMYRLKS
jgi:hypothetical protein